MLQRPERARYQIPAEHWLLLDCYLQGWAEVNLAKVLDAAAPDYEFYDPLVGRFCWSSLPRYFELVRGRFTRAGVDARRDLSFLMRGPMYVSREYAPRDVPDGMLFWREAPRIGLAGMARIVVGPCGIVSESVTYDPNLASDLLCRP
jgi:hypothetical protein